MKKRFFAILMAAMMMTAALSGCGGTEQNGQQPDTDANQPAAQDTAFTYKVGISNMADSDENCFACCEAFKNMVESDEFAQSVGHKVSVEWVDSDGDISNQLSNIETLIAKDVDAVFMLGFDAAGNSSAVKACNDAGIPMFLAATEAEEGSYKFIGFNEYDCGKVQGEYVAKNAEQGDKICYMQGTAGQENSIQREQGFMDAIAERKDLEVLSTQAGNFSIENAMQVTEDWIQAYNDKIDWIVTQDNSMGGGAIEVLKAANMQDDVRLSIWIVPGTWDAEYIKNGEAEQAVFVSFVTLGETMAQVCEKYYKGEQIEDRTWMELYSVTKDNYSEFFG